MSQRAQTFKYFYAFIAHLLSGRAESTYRSANYVRKRPFYCALAGIENHQFRSHHTLLIIIFNLFIEA